MSCHITVAQGSASVQITKGNRQPSAVQRRPDNVSVVLMAFPPMYAQQAKGTLMPGQMIAVNKYNVQVERFLSQGNSHHPYINMYMFRAC